MKSIYFRISKQPFHVVALITLVFCATLLLALMATHAIASAAKADTQTSRTLNNSLSLNEAGKVLAATGPEIEVRTAYEAALPPPATDPCQHCHLAGENKGLWIPLARWTLFGTMGLIFIFGIVRTSSAIITRSPWKPITTRSVDWIDERYQVSEPLSKILAKPVPKYALRWFYCLGGITAFLFVVQAITGIMLAFYYKPTPEAAYASIQYIETQVHFGAAIRMIHHWAANGMIVLCLAHMIRVFVMGAYKAPRELNWISGVILLILTLAFGFTGYLLPWDQRAFWATTVGSEIAAAIPVIGNLALVFLRVGWDVTGETLSRFYAMHIIFVPILTVAFMIGHFLMIRRQGIMKPL